MEEKEQETVETGEQETVETGEQEKEELVEEAEQELVEDPDLENAESTDEDSELEALKQEKDEIYQRLLRLQAEYDNFRKRTQKEKEADRKYRSQSLVTELLPAVDNFERALQVEIKDEAAKSVVDGLQMVYRQLADALKNEGVEEIKTEGEIFDPNLHQAVMQVEDENYQSNQIVEELQKGYRLKDRVIRPSMVKVNQ
ncbi:nucleotide exchange factor GrpE [Aquibacillus kalidii]|uniref:nucleotide exchange factor GrpE n=1 Tax=Aquibacillus kalidii TaxID=2762597 RepID=UPI0016472DFB|nr:nucleotide exchange factor GrpE [Aquibacillus kalidii]